MDQNIYVGVAPSAGSLGLKVIRGDGRTERYPEPTPWPTAVSLGSVTQHALPQKGLPEEVNDWRSDNWKRNFRRSMKALFGNWMGKRMGIRPLIGGLWITVIRGEEDLRLEYGLASLRVVTDDGVEFIVDAFQNTTELENMKYHGYGTSSTAENQTDAALGTELTTQYPTDNTRPTGTTTEGASANIYRTVATLSPDASVTVAEHGIFDQASNAGGVLLDRSVFTGVPLTASDSLQTTYDLTFPAGS